jgi:hypothetical protein
LRTGRGAASAYVAALQRLAGLPVDPGRVYAEHSLYWVIWYLGLPALLLGVAGLAIVTRNCLRALLTWRDPDGTARAWALPAAIIGWGMFAVLWQPGTVPDQPWASRTLVPVALPGLAVLAVWAAARMTVQARERGAGPVAMAATAACFVAALVVPPAAITFGIGPWRPTAPAINQAFAGVAFRPTGVGELSAVQMLCGAIPAHSAVLVVDSVAAREYTQVVRGMCRVPTGVMVGASPGEVEAVMGSIERAGRRPVLLAGRPAELAAYGGPVREVMNLTTQQDAHLLTRPPTSTWPARYDLWLSMPGSGTTTGS